MLPGNSCVVTIYENDLKNLHSINHAFAIYTNLIQLSLTLCLRSRHAHAIFTDLCRFLSVNSKNVKCRVVKLYRASLSLCLCLNFYVIFLYFQIPRVLDRFWKVVWNRSNQMILDGRLNGKPSVTLSFPLPLSLFLCCPTALPLLFRHRSFSPAPRSLRLRSFEWVNAVEFDASSGKWDPVTSDGPDTLAIPIDIFHDFVSVFA